MRGKDYTFLIEVHYSKEDEDFSGDYYSIVLKDKFGGEVDSFGDDYHDRGMERMEGFLRGVEYATKRKPVTAMIQIADKEY